MGDAAGGYLEGEGAIEAKLEAGEYVIRVGPNEGSRLLRSVDWANLSAAQQAWLTWCKERPKSVAFDTAAQTAFVAGWQACSDQKTKDQDVGPRGR